MLNLSTTKILIPKDVEAVFDSSSHTLILKKDERQNVVQLSKNINTTIDSNYISININTEKKLKNNLYKKYLNTNIALIKQNLKGLKQPFKLKLKLIGIGFKCDLSENQLELKIGYSHICNIDIPKEITVNLINSTTIACCGSSWNELTNFAAKVKRVKTMDPYKIKGIFLEHEHINIRKKEGKKNKK